MRSASSQAGLAVKHCERTAGWLAVFPGMQCIHSWPGSCHAQHVQKAAASKRTHLLAVAEKARYSSTLLAPAVSAVSAAEPPPTTTDTHDTGPATSRHAALTPPFSVAACCWVGTGHTAQGIRGNPDSLPRSLPQLPTRACHCPRMHPDVAHTSTRLQLWCLGRGAVGQADIGQRLRQRGGDTLATAKEAANLGHRDCGHSICGNALTTLKHTTCTCQQRAQVPRQGAHHPATAAAAAAVLACEQQPCLGRARHSRTPPHALLLVY